MQITALSGGVGGARFLTALHRHLPPEENHHLTVIANTGDDMTYLSQRICPDLDTLLYAFAAVVHPEQGWGRRDESFRVSEELRHFGVAPEWFTLGDLDLATHLTRTLLLTQGIALSEVTARLASRWGLVERGVHLLPMTDTPVETHAVLAEGETERAVHFQEWWVRMQAHPVPERFAVVGLRESVPAPGVCEAIEQADLILLPPSNPVVSLGIILGVPGIREAIRNANAPVVGVSPVRGGRPFRGHADVCLQAVGIEPSSAAVGALYDDLLTTWIHDPCDQPALDASWTHLPLNTDLSDPAATRALMSACLDHVQR